MSLSLTYSTYPNAIQRVLVGFDTMLELSSTVVARKANTLIPENCLGLVSVTTRGRVCNIVLSDHYYAGRNDCVSVPAISKQSEDVREEFEQSRPKLQNVRGRLCGDFLIFIEAS